MSKAELNDRSQCFWQTQYFAHTTRLALVSEASRDDLPHIQPNVPVPIHGPSAPDDAATHNGSIA